MTLHILISKLVPLDGAEKLDDDLKNELVTLDANVAVYLKFRTIIGCCSY
jgi:hypothetical protein